MLAYTYDEDTKEFKFTQEAQKDPLGENYLLPADSTFEQVIDVREGYVAVWKDPEWIETLDKRGSWQVKLDDVTFSIVDYLGEAKTGYQFISDNDYNRYQEDPDRYKVKNGVFVDISDTEEYIQIKQEKEAIRVQLLTCTKRVLVLMLEELGLDYFEQLLPAIEANRQAKLEWELCSQLQRSNPLIEQIATQFEITSEQLDMLFKVANNENTVEELRALKGE